MELTSIIMAIAVTPPHCHVTVYTDSQYCINTYNTIERERLFHYTRPYFKLQYLSYWYILFDLINLQQLTLSFVKVQVYAMDPTNCIVDTMAKKAIHHSRIDITLMDTSYFLDLPIYVAIRINNLPQKFIKELCNTKQILSFIGLNRLTKY